ncbi:ig-like domain-containing protein [Caerostris extrusa]|uniref:Ig-like domain-containing protein n=1 Tax=Caerostris extrusa TaxID=172846 RepID=A0AAV4X5B0_CAEEX|nr:ig-like domain-containing protein [Caerostris extrusa]
MESSLIILILLLIGEAENEISFVASSDDDKAVYTCATSSIMTPEPMVKSVTLKVLYAPSSVMIKKAQKEAKPGDVISAKNRA